MKFLQFSLNFRRHVSLIVQSISIRPLFLSSSSHNSHIHSYSPVCGCMFYSQFNAANPPCRVISEDITLSTSNLVQEFAQVLQNGDLQSVASHPISAECQKRLADFDDHQFLTILSNFDAFFQQKGENFRGKLSKKNPLNRLMLSFDIESRKRFADGDYIKAFSILESNSFFLSVYKSKMIQRVLWYHCKTPFSSPTPILQRYLAFMNEHHLWRKPFKFYYVEYALQVRLDELQMSELCQFLRAFVVTRFQYVNNDELLANIFARFTAQLCGIHSSHLLTFLLFANCQIYIYQYATLTPNVAKLLHFLDSNFEAYPLICHTSAATLSTKFLLFRPQYLQKICDAVARLPEVSVSVLSDESTGAAQPGKLGKDEDLAVNSKGVNKPYPIPLDSIEGSFPRQCDCNKLPETPTNISNSDRITSVDFKTEDFQNRYTVPLYHTSANTRNECPNLVSNTRMGDVNQSTSSSAEMVDSDLSFGFAKVICGQSPPSFDAAEMKNWPSKLECDHAVLQSTTIAEEVAKPELPSAAANILGNELPGPVCMKGDHSTSISDCFMEFNDKILPALQMKNLINAVAFFNCIDMAAQLKPFLESHPLGLHFLETKPKLYVHMITYLAYLGYFSPLIDTFLSKEFLLKTYRYLNPCGVHRHILRLDAAMQIECPNYQGSCLEPEFRDKMASFMVTHYPKGVQFCESQTFIAIHKRFGSETTAREYVLYKYTMEEAAILLSELFGGDSYTHLCRALPHLTGENLIWCTDAAGNPQKLAAEVRDAPTINFEIIDPKQQRWYILVCSSRNIHDQEGAGAMVVGKEVPKVRQMRLLGFQVVEVVHEEWEMMSHDQKLSTLKQKIRLPVIK